MPGNVPNATVPVVAGHPIVFPQALCKSFSEVRSWAARINEYHDGSTERQNVVGSSRKTWRLIERLVPAAMATLRSFWLAHPIDPFYFYNPSEPLGTNLEGSNYDSTGASAQGRYIVRFNGDLTEQIFIPRAEIGIELVEIA